MQLLLGTLFLLSFAQRLQGLVLDKPLPPAYASRRDCLWRAVTACTTTFVLLTSPPTHASSPSLSPDKSVWVEGRVDLAPDATVQAVEGQANALYVTCRPNRPDNVPAAILSGTRGKPPPVLAARFENPTFPLKFSLDAENLTPEGANTGGGESPTGYWWSGDDLVVSARWDADGVAATRSPEDLVGRAVLLRSGDRGGDAAVVVVQLQGRGAFGKFATQKN